MDIRNFFGAKPKPGKVEDQPAAMKKKRPKPVVLSSDSDSDGGSKKSSDKPKKPVAKKPARQVLSDSDDDFTSKPGSSKPSKKIEEKSREVLKEVDPKDFFGQAAKKSKPEKTEKECTKKVTDEKKKRKVPADEEIHDDEAFASLLKSIDDDKEVKPSPSKKMKNGASPTKLKEPAKKSPVASPSKILSSPPAKNGKKSPKVEKSSPKKEEIKVETKKVTPPKHSIKNEIKKTSIKTEENISKAIAERPQSAPVSADSQLWVDKYKPTNTKGIIGQQTDKSNLKKLQHWLKNWQKNNSGGKMPPRPPPFKMSNDDGGWAKAVLLSGPPGVGKTTTSYLVAKELGLDIMELNASDTRSKKMLGACLGDALNNLSLAKESKNRVLLMDEVDGMAGNEDRGGMAELIMLIKSSKVPIICMCNDRNHQKIRSLANHCFDLRFHRPRPEQIRAAMMSICFKEKIKIEPSALMELIVGCNQDVRQVLHHLSMLKAKSEQGTKLGAEEAKKEADASKKTSIKIGPWDVVRKVFSASEHKGMSIMDKSDLFFHDYSLGPLFVQENYLLAVPNEANFDKKKTMLLTSKAADSICMGDLVEKTIRSQQAWSLLPTEAIFASVIPGEYMAGHVAGQIEFPKWLGKYSRQNKFDRILQELQVHTRLSAGLSKSSLNQDFIQHMRDVILRPLKDHGQDGIGESVKAMEFYSLMREDLDNLIEVTTWPDQNDPMKAIETKVKAAFTRSYNKEVVLPYAKVSNVTKKTKTTQDPMLDGSDEEDDNNEDDDKIESDAMIKAKKPSAAASKKAEAKKAEPKGKGKGKKSK